MLLVVDIGNTHIVIGVYKKRELLFSFRMATDKKKTEDEYWVLLSYLLEHNNIKYPFIKRVVVSSVVPILTSIFENMIQKYFKLKPLFVNANIKKNIRLKIDNPFELGADRLVNAMAGYELYGGPLIIVDFGTATTFCAISRDGEYLGGAIAPGLILSVESLTEKTAKLPQIPLFFPKSSIGKNTIAGMQSGLMFGYVSLVDGIIQRFKKEMQTEDIFVVATGGLAKIVSLESKCINEINFNLTLEGLRLIDELNNTPL